MKIYVCFFCIYDIYHFLESTEKFNANPTFMSFSLQCFGQKFHEPLAWNHSLATDESIFAIRIRPRPRLSTPSKETTFQPAYPGWMHSPVSAFAGSPINASACHHCSVSSIICAGHSYKHIYIFIRHRRSISPLFFPPRSGFRMASRHRPKKNPYLALFCSFQP